jgi:pimeloyl-ACP methyl ester carboxylesterase
MPFVENRGIKIHYEVEGQGPALVMQHGLTNNLESWRTCGYAKNLAEKHTLIMVDARGHGRSDKPHDPAAYRPADFAGDILAILKEKGIKKSGYMGYSMGGAIGFQGIARNAMEWFDYLILGGMSPYNTEIEQQQITSRLVVMKMAAEQGMEAYVAYLEKRDGIKYQPEERARRLANDPVALHAILSSMAAWPGAADILKNITVPCFIFAGEEDGFCPGARKGAAALPHARFISFPGLNHVQAEQRSELVLPHINKFLTEMSVI